MRKLLTSLFLLFFAHSSYTQPCSLVTISTSVLRILPECNLSDGSITLSNTEGGVSPYTYELGNTKSQFGSFFNLPIGVYDIVITDSRSCSTVVSVKLLYSDIEEIINPSNAFTPNDDGVNDTWVIGGIEGFSGSEVRVFNRWGQLVHQNSEYTNSAGWDGKQNGSKLPAATYYYVISIFNNCIEEYLKGTITIIR